MADNNDLEKVVRIRADTSGVTEPLNSANQKMDKFEKLFKQSANAVISSTAKMVNSISTSFGNKFGDNMTKPVTQSFAKLDSSIKNIQNTIKGTNDTKSIFSNLDTKSLISEFDKINNKIDRLADTENKMKFLGVDKASNSYKGLSYEMKNAETQAYELSKAIVTALPDKIEEIKANMEEIASQKTPTKEYKAMQDSVEKAEVALEKLLNQRDKLLSKSIDKQNKEWDSYGDKIAKAKDKVALFEEKLKSIQSSGKALEAPSTKEYERVSAALKKSEESLERAVRYQSDLKANSVTKNENAWRNNETAIAEATAKLDKYKQSLADMTKYGSNLEPTYVPNQDYVNLEKNIAKVTRRLDELKAKQSAKLATGVDQTSYAWKQLAQNVNETQAMLDNYNAKLQVTSKYDTVTKESSAYVELKNNIALAEAELSKLVTKRSELQSAKPIEESDAWIKLDTQIKNATADVEKYKAELDAISSADLGKEQIPTKAYEQAALSLQNARAELDRLVSLQGQIATSAPVEATEAYTKLSAQIREAEDRVNSARSALEGFEGGDTKLFDLGIDSAEYGKAAEQLSTYESALGNATSRLDSFRGTASYAVSALSNLSGAAGVAMSIASGLGNIFVKAFSKIKSGINSAVKKFKLFNNNMFSMDKMAKKVTRSLTSVWTTFVGRIRRLAAGEIFNDVTENIGKLANMSPHFNTAVSNMIDSAKALGAQIIAGIEPIVSALGPIVSEITDELTKLADAASQFIARLSGGDTYIKAIKGQSDYAKSIDNSTSSTEALNKATKDYKETVLGFDQLNKMEDASSGIASSSLETTYTGSDAFNELATDMHDAAENGDFETVGKDVTKGISLITQSLADAVGWSKNKDRIKDTLSKVSDTINGFSKGLIEHGAQIGSNIADIGNTLVESAGYLLNNISALDLGAGIGEILDSSINNFNWDTLGADIVDGIEFALDFVTGLVNSDFLADLGTALSDAIRGMIEALDPEKWAAALDAIVKGIFDFFANINIDNEDAAALGNKIVEFLKLSLLNLDWQAVSDGVSNVIRILIDTLSGLLTSIVEAVFDPMTWVAIGVTVINTLISAFEILLNAITDLIELLVNGIIDIVNGGISMLNAGLSLFGEDAISEIEHIDISHTTLPKYNVDSETGEAWWGDKDKSDKDSTTDPYAYLYDGTYDKTQTEAEDKLYELLKSIDGDGATTTYDNTGYATSDDYRYDTSAYGGLEATSSDDITNAVASGVEQSMDKYVGQMTDAMNTQGDSGDIVLNVDSIELARAVVKGTTKISRTANHSVSFS
jgi:hypothetical protein